MDYLEYSLDNICSKETDSPQNNSFSTRPNNYNACCFSNLVVLEDSCLNKLWLTVATNDIRWRIDIPSRTDHQVLQETSAAGTAGVFYV